MTSCYFLYIPTDVVPLYPYTPGIVFLVCRGRGSLASHTHFHILRFAQGKGSGQRSIRSLFPTPGFGRANQISLLKMT